jgi:hypothetical protein
VLVRFSISDATAPSAMLDPCSSLHAGKPRDIRAVWCGVVWCSVFLFRNATKRKKKEGIHSFFCLRIII